MDATTLIRDLHQRAAAHVLQLADAFYGAVEDGLFELGQRSAEAERRQYCFDSMRELRLQRDALMQGLARRIAHLEPLWFQPRQPHMPPLLERGEELESILMHMAENSTERYRGLLEELAERAGAVTGARSAPIDTLPISPAHIAGIFLPCSLRFSLGSSFPPYRHSLLGSTGNLEDAASALNLFLKTFRKQLLDELGTVYDECNRALRSYRHCGPSCADRHPRAQMRAEPAPERSTSEPLRPAGGRSASARWG